MRRLIGLTAFLLCACLSGCGYQLRGYTDVNGLAQDITAVAVQLDGSTKGLKRPLALTLKRMSIATHPEADIQLTFTGHDIETAPLAFGIEGEVRRERLTGRLTFAVLSDDPRYAIAPTPLVAARDRLRFPNYDLADSEEKQDTIQELNRDLIDSAFRHMQVVYTDRRGKAS